MIEREFVKQYKKEFEIQEFISKTLKNVGHSHTKLQRTPLGEKILIFASRPGLIVGRKGENISRLTSTLKSKFKLENPQIEISEVENPQADAQIVAENIASALERFGIKRFKGIMHKALQDALSNGAMGIEIIISGKVPSARARSWRVLGGYLKKCGDSAMKDVKRAMAEAQLKSGTVGVKVRIMPKMTRPDDMTFKEEPVVAKEEKPAEKKAEGKNEQKNA
jgi:small subunit ribosomal protein S3